MNAQNVDRIRGLLLIVAMIGTAVAMGVAPTLWASF